MLDWLVITLAKFILWLRYDIKLTGMEKIAEKGKNGILFLPNHPALIDPVILFAYLKPVFSPRGFGDKDQVDRFLIRYFAKRWGVRTIPSIAAYGPAAKAKIEEVLDESIEGLKKGENLLIWPAGRIYRGFLESLGANSAVERIIQNYPDVRIVLIRTRGLWGSSFGWASGHAPKVVPVVKKALLLIFANAVFFTPRRKVTIEFYEPEDLPKNADRNTFNRFLENYYNENALPNTYVPYTIWEKGGTRILPEPKTSKFEADYSSVPAATRQIVLKHLNEVTGISQLNNTDRLAADLGMDSLARTDLLIWLETEFGFSQADADAMQTVGDVLLAACGKFISTTQKTLKKVPAKWFKKRKQKRIFLPEGKSITEIFLKQAVAHPDTAVIADQISGVKTYRDIVTGCLILKKYIEKLPGDYIGIMLPASVGANIFYLSVLFSGKIPVMVNWTSGPKNIIASLESLGVKNILTAKSLVDRIQMQGIDLSQISDYFVFSENLKSQITGWAKLKAFLASYLSWNPLRKAIVPETAAVLFTSGSETIPKAVPLTHANLISNMRDVLNVVEIFETDRLIGFLPPFHSLGLTGTILLPLCGAAQIVYYPNPNEADILAKSIAAYKVTLLLGTPTFLAGILRISNKLELASLRLVVSGAEQCPPQVYEAFSSKCKNAVMLEGYGVTECSPIISLNDPANPKPFTIGKILPSLDCIFVSPENLEIINPPCTGILLVRGQSVFNGYLNYQGKSPFVEIAGKKWYNTGDLVSIDSEKVMTFRGRLKRFVKLGGEMVSLPAIEAVLQNFFATDKDKGPVLAIEAAQADNPELVLFTTLDIDREIVNKKIREAGLSGLHSIRKVIKLEEMPLLGTGKTNYRALKQILNESIE